MNAWQRVVSIGAVTIVAFDAIASAASKALGFPYAHAIYGEMLIYLAVGYFAARSTGNVGRAALAAGMVGAVEGTLGWWASWIIGPGRLPGNPSGVEFALELAWGFVFVVGIASVVGAIAGLAGRRRVLGGETGT